MNLIRLGVIGCGGIACWVHLRIARHLRGATLVATADPDPGARARAERLSGVPSHASTDDLLARGDVDAVIITAPTHLHADLAVAACTAGKHVYLEKPLAASVADGVRVVDAARQSEVKIVLGYNRRFHPLFAHTRDLLRNGVIGRVLSAQTTFCEPAAPDAMPPWKRQRRTGGGVLLDLASHHIDLLRWCLNDEVATVSATIESAFTEQDSARLLLHMSGGASIQSSFSCRSALSDSLNFAGEGGTLHVDRHRVAVSLRLPRRFGYGMRTAWVMPPLPLVTWWGKQIVRPSRDPSYRRALETFVSIVHGNPRPHQSATVDDGMAALEVLEAAEQSAQSGHGVSLTELGALR